MLPRARTAHLVIQELPSETLVFDQRTNKAHCLNRTTALVWRHCDGRTNFADLGRLVELDLAIGGGAVVVQLALEQLASRHLLEGTVERGSPAQRRSRRELLKQLAAAAVALPVILTVSAPRANAAGSPVSCSGKANGTSCGSGATQVCCSNTCTNTSTDPSNCGRCGLMCLTPEATGCNNGGCCIPASQPCPVGLFPCCTGSCLQTGFCG